MLNAIIGLVIWAVSTKVKKKKGVFEKGHTTRIKGSRFTVLDVGEAVDYYSDMILIDQ